MKALRYLLIMIGLVSFLSVNAQGLAQQPEVKMTSTSTMVGSGSCLPQAAATGVYTTYDTPNSNARKAPGPRRVQEDDSPGTEPGQEEDTPIGDVMWPLMLLALTYVSVRAFRRKRA